jgi:DNA-binding beta-propeller fold protein YncE
VRRLLAAALGCLASLAAAPAIADPPAAATGFQHPESVYWDAPTDAWYVSNFGGSQPDAKGRDPDGYLSKLDADGNVVAERWVDGLRSPKGMRRSGNLLYLADVGQLVVIDLTAPPHVTRRVDLDAIGAQLPNDVATDPSTGDLYVSDTLRDAIYRIDRRTLTPTVFLESADLEAPNGLLVDGGKLMVASYGPGLDRDTFRTTSPGRILEVDLSTRAVTPFRGMARVGNLDGIEKQGSSYLVTDNPAGRLLRVAQDGSVSEVAKDFGSAADLGLRPDDFAAIPQLRGDTVRFLKIPHPQ